jgi:glycosyltransferase involved in cell wall biosynthesis
MANARTDIGVNTGVEGSSRCQAPTEGASCRVLIPFSTPHLYGMERAVIEIFDALRPDVEPCFVQGSLIYKAGLPVIEEMRKRGLNISLLPDKDHWPKIGEPRSVRHFCEMLKAVVVGNLAILKAAWNKDILYVPGICYGHLAVLAALWYRIRHRRVIHHFHDLDTNIPTFPLWIPLVTDFVHNTELGYAAVGKSLPGIRRKRNVVIPYILDVEPRGPEDPDAKRALAGTRNLFFVGQISTHKGVDILLEAFKTVAESHPDAMLHLVGGCAENFRSELGELCSHPTLAGRVKCWGYRNDALQLLRSAYLYVHTSPPSRFRESYGRSVVEAMALGVPTVCFRSGALQEIVVDHETGFICEESPAALADAIGKMLDDEVLRNRCGERAADRYRTLYSKGHVRTRWLEFFLGFPAADQPCAAVTRIPVSR